MLVKIIVEENNLIEGTIIERSDLQFEILKCLCKKLKDNSGCVLIIDYGSELGQVDTLQGMHKNKYCDFLAKPGEVDLTSHVNFELLNEFFKKNNLKVKKIMTQQDFLRNMGIIERAENISKNMRFTEKTNLFLRLKRLMSHKLMGNLFKVILTYKSKNNNYFGFN